MSEELKITLSEDRDKFSISYPGTFSDYSEEFTVGDRDGMSQFIFDYFFTIEEQEKIIDESN